MNKGNMNVVFGNELVNGVENEVRVDPMGERLAVSKEAYFAINLLFNLASIFGSEITKKTTGGETWYEGGCYGFTVDASGDGYDYGEPQAISLFRPLGVPVEFSGLADHEIRSMARQQALEVQRVLSLKEVSVLKCELGYGNNSNWAVIREDDRRFAELAAKHPGDVKPVSCVAAYEGRTAYDANGCV